MNTNNTTKTTDKITTLRKHYKSKLDPFTQVLVQMESEGKTLKEMIEYLKGQNAKASIALLSKFLTKQRANRFQAQFSATAADVSENCNAVKDEFEKNQPADLQTLMQLHRNIIFQLKTMEKPEAAIIRLADQMLHHAQAFDVNEKRLQLRDRLITVAERKLEFAVRQALIAAGVLERVSSDSGLTEDQKIERARIEMFGSAPK